MPIRGSKKKRTRLTKYYTCRIMAISVPIFASVTKREDMNWYFFSGEAIADRFECIERDPQGGVGTVYPVPMTLHYIPEALTRLEMMKVAISWEDPNLYESLVSFCEMLLLASRDGERVIVVHGQDANSLLLLYTISCIADAEIYHIDVTPVDYKPILRETTSEDWIDMHCEDEYVRQYDPMVYSVEDVTPAMAEKLIGKEILATPEERSAWREIWNHWGGEDARDFPILVDQHGDLFHPYDVYLNASIFAHTPTDSSASIASIADEVKADHPQVGRQLIVAHIVKMADQRQIKWAGEPGPEGNVIQYRTNIAARWNFYQDLNFLHDFADYAGKKIILSPEEIEAEFERENQDTKDFWGKGHLYREVKQQSRQAHEQMNLIKWAYAFNENWGWYHLMEVMVSKMEMMVDYMRNWTPIAEGPVYADQMQRAIGLMRIIINKGGESDYNQAGDDDDCFDAQHFSHYVNYRNRERFPSPNYDGLHFWCEAQRIRFDKAWNILWEMFRTKLLTWED